MQRELLLLLFCYCLCIFPTQFREAKKFALVKENENATKQFAKKKWWQQHLPLSNNNNTKNNNKKDNNKCVCVCLFSRDKAEWKQPPLMDKIQHHNKISSIIIIVFVLFVALFMSSELSTKGWAIIIPHTVSWESIRSLKADNVGLLVTKRLQPRENIQTHTGAQTQGQTSSWFCCQCVNEGMHV